jgi:hypothetical protein
MMVQMVLMDNLARRAIKAILVNRGLEELVLKY